MRTTPRRLLAGLVIGGVTLLANASALQAQAYPARPVKIIVPYAPGGQGDITARAISEHLGTRLGQPVTVENRPGANGVIGTDLIAKAKPDGYTIGVVVASHVLAPALMPQLPYDPISDFAAVTMTARTEIVFTSPASLPVNSFQDFIAYAKQNPGKLAYKSAGPGSNSHLFGAWLADAAGIEMIHVPYKGGGDSLPDLMSGVVQLGIDTLPAVRGAIDSGKLKLLAAGGPNRSTRYPNVPTVAEAGIAGFTANSWGMVLAPKGTPRPIVDRLNKEIVAILSEPKVKERFEATGASIVASTPDEAQDVLKNEEQLYSQLIKKLSIKLAN